MSDYKQTRDAAGKITSQYDKMLRNLDDDLVNKLYDRRVCSQAQNSCRNDQILNQAADRIEELEAKLAKAVEVLQRIAQYDHQKSASNALRYYLPNNNLSSVKEVLDAVAETDIQAWAKNTLTELKGQNNE